MSRALDEDQEEGQKKSMAVGKKSQVKIVTAFIKHMLSDAILSS